MKRKNLAVSIFSLSLLAVLAIGATLAYFTDKDEVVNVFTVGQVAIDLKEQKDGDSVWTDEGLVYEGVNPGASVSKKAHVFIDEGSDACYVRVLVQVTADSTSWTEEDLNAVREAVHTAIGPEWSVTTTEDGALSCVYQEIALPGAELTLFDTITIPISLGNNVSGSSFQIKLTAYAVQADNVELETLDWDSLQYDS